MIQAHDPMIIGDAKNIAVTFHEGQKMISLALDNSAGRMAELRRGDIRLIDDSEDVTSRVFGGSEAAIVPASLDNFEKAMNWLRRCTRGLEAGNNK
jgi:hypothetical protein